MFLDFQAGVNNGPTREYPLSATRDKTFGSSTHSSLDGKDSDTDYHLWFPPISESVKHKKAGVARLARLRELDVFRNAKPRYGGGNVYWVNTAVIEALSPDKSD